MTFARILSMAVVCFLVGCGLADYQSRMDIERKRMKLFDEEDKALGYPIMPPTYIVKVKEKDKEKDKEVPAWPGFDVFLRVPKDYDYKEKDFTIGGTVYLFRYPGPEGLNLFVAASKIGVAKEDRFLPGELSVDEFRKKVVQAVREYYRKQYNLDLPPPVAPEEKEGTKKAELYKKLAIQPEGARENPPAVNYEMLELPDRPKPKAKEKDKDAKETHFQVYFHQHGIHQVALVYQTPKKEVNTEDVTFKRDYSLKSLDLTEKASQKRNDFVASRKNLPPPPSQPEKKKDK